MGKRRMFSLSIVDSAKFIKMPATSQLLYFHLGMRADDDGVVEAFNVLRITGLNEDDLKVLITKGYVKLLNDDLVSYIVDWKEHNTIRADRKVDSIYKQLLLQVCPDIKLLEPRKRADCKSGQPTDNQWTSSGQHKLSKDKLSKYKSSTTTTNNIEEPCCSNSSNEEFNIFNYMQHRGFVSISPVMAEQIQSDIEMYSLEEVKQAIDIADNNGKHTYSYVKGILERRRSGAGKDKSRKDTEWDRAMKEMRERMERGEDPF